MFKRNKRNATFHRSSIRNSVMNQLIFEDVFKDKKLTRKYKKKTRKIMAGLSNDDIMSINAIVITRLNDFSIFTKLKETTFEDLKTQTLDLIGIINEYKEEREEKF